MVTAALLLAALTASAAAPAKAPKKPELAVGDGVVVTLKNKTKIEGTFQGRDTAVWVEVDGGQIGIDPDTIASMTGSNTAEAEFNQRKALLKPRDSAGYWELAQWADSKGLKLAAESAARTTIQIEPNHYYARTFLGYQRIDSGGWHEPDEMKAARGLVQYQGRWLTEEELEDAKDAQWRRAKKARQEQMLAEDRTIYAKPAETVQPSRAIQVKKTRYK